MAESLLHISAYALNSLENPFLFGGMVALGALIVGLIRRHYSVAFFIAIALTFSLTHTLKSLFQIPRPSDALVDAVGYRFPSMHSAIGSALIISIAYYGIRHTERRLLKGLYVCVALVLIAFVGYTRIILNVHEPVDVVVGALIGLVVSLTVHTLAQKVA